MWGLHAPEWNCNFCTKSIVFPTRCHRALLGVGGRGRAWMGFGERSLMWQHCDCMPVATPRNISQAKPVQNTLTRVSTSLTRRLWANMQKYLNTNIHALLSAGMRLGRIRQSTVDYSAKHCGLFRSTLTTASPTTSSEKQGWTSLPLFSPIYASVPTGSLPSQRKSVCPGRTE